MTPSRRERIPTSTFALLAASIEFAVGLVVLVSTATSLWPRGPVFVDLTRGHRIDLTDTITVLIAMPLLAHSWLTLRHWLRLAHAGGPGERAH